MNEVRIDRNRLGWNCKNRQVMFIYMVKSLTYFISYQFEVKIELFPIYRGSSHFTLCQGTEY